MLRMLVLSHQLASACAITDISAGNDVYLQAFTDFSTTFDALQAVFKPQADEMLDSIKFLCDSYVPSAAAAAAGSKPRRK